ncbi:ArsR/SmtB family transcription factor [Planctomycetota bacterium]
MYRASRYFRVLGNPTAYLILRNLEKGGRTPKELSEEVGRTLATISMTLRHLRQINLVRYETRGRNKVYQLKDKAVLKILDSGEKLAEKMRSQQD